MDRLRRSRSIVSAYLPSLFQPLTESATDATLVQGMIVFGFGRFQRLALLCAQITTFVAYSQSFAVVTDLEPVDHWCRPGAEYANVSAKAWKEQYLPRGPGGRGHDGCRHYEEPHKGGEEDHGADNTTRVAVACDAWDYDTRHTGTTVLVFWNIVCDRRWYQHVIKAAFMCGAALSVPCAGLASNRWGRRPIMWAAVCVLLCSGAATTLAPTLIAFIVLRFVSSAAVSVLEVVSFVLLFESTPVGPRDPFCALAVCWPTVLAPVYVATVAYVASNWRMWHACLALPALFLFLTVSVTEESPHWLIVNHRFHEARRVALWAALLNDEEPDVVIERLEKVKDMLVLGTAAAGTTAAAEERGQSSRRRRSQLRYFRSRTMLAHCFVVFGCWFTVYGNYYYRDMEGPHASFVKWVVIAGNVPAMTIAYFIIKHHGRLAPLVVFLMAVSFMLLYSAVSQTMGLSFPIQLIVMWRSLLLNIAYVLLCVHTVALFPTQVRSVAFAGAYTFGRLGAMVADAFPVFVTSLGYELDALYMAVAAVNLLLFSLLLLPLSEKRLLDIVNRVDALDAAGTAQPMKRSSVSPDSVCLKQ
nr:solute carrier family 22 member 6-like [Rhipicephalus microplus]